MRIGFFGSPDFAADILNDIAGIVDIACVYTQPDRVRSRGKKLLPSSVKAKALELGIPVYTPESLKSEEVVAELAAFDLDLICVAAYGVILPKKILDIPTYGCINVHASLLPRHRGAAPIERAILEGDEEAGVCIMRMEEGLDTGDYCIRRAIPIGDMNAIELTSELASLGASALLTAISQIDANGVKWTAQDDDAATYASKIEKGELDLDPSLSALTNLRRVRASSDAHPCRAHIAGRDVTVLRATLVADQEDVVNSGEDVIEKGMAYVRGNSLFLQCVDSSFEVVELKPSGKNAMPARAFISGNRELSSGSAALWRAI